MYSYYFVPLPAGQPSWSAPPWSLAISNDTQRIKRVKSTPKCSRWKRSVASTEWSCVLKKINHLLCSSSIVRFSFLSKSLPMEAEVHDNSKNGQSGPPPTRCGTSFKTCQSNSFGSNLPLISISRWTRPTHALWIRRILNGDPSNMNQMWLMLAMPSSTIRVYLA